MSSPVEDSFYIDRVFLKVYDPLKDYPKVNCHVCAQICEMIYTRVISDEEPTRHYCSSKCWDIWKSKDKNVINPSKKT